MALLRSWKPHFISYIHKILYSSVKQLSPFTSVSICQQTMTESDSRTTLVWDLLVCSQLTEPGTLATLLAGGGKLPSLTILLTFTLQSQLFKSACASTPCQPASQPAPAVKSGSWNLKAHAALLHCTVALAPLWLSVPPNRSSSSSSSLCGCNYVSCSEIYKTVWEFVSVNQKTFIIMFSVCVSLSLSLSVSSVIWPIFFHMNSF